MQTHVYTVHNSVYTPVSVNRPNNNYLHSGCIQCPIIHCLQSVFAHIAYMKCLYALLIPRTSKLCPYLCLIIHWLYLLLTV